VSKKQYKLADEKGLHLLVHSNGSKYWRFRYRFLNKEKLLALGVYPEISLKEARAKRDIARKQLSNGIDPSAQKKKEKLSQETAAENCFEKVAHDWLEIKKQAIQKDTVARIQRRLEIDIFPHLGHRPISDIKPLEMLAALKKSEERGVIETRVIKYRWF